MFKQISEFFENIFPKNQCGFRKGHSTQQCLLVMLQKWKRSVVVRHLVLYLPTYLRLLIAWTMRFMIIFHIENIEHGLIIHIVNDWLLCLGYHKAQFWHHFYSTFFWQICFLYLVILILKTLQMIIRHIILLKM